MNRFQNFIERSLQGHEKFSSIISSIIDTKIDTKNYELVKDCRLARDYEV